MIAEAIKQQVPIVSVLRRFGVEIAEGKAKIPIKCPFHDDHSPSAWVKTDTNRLTCFTCDENWDQIAVTQAFLSCSFPDACEWLCREFGVDGDRRTLLWQQWERREERREREDGGVSCADLFHAEWWRCLDTHPDAERPLRVLRARLYASYDGVDPVAWYRNAMSELELVLDAVEEERAE